MLSPAHTWSLTLIAAAAGFAMLWVFRRFADPHRTRLAKRKLRAHLYAFRLFADEPGPLLRAQRELLVWNARYLGLMLRPAAVLAIPMMALLIHLDAIYGKRPLWVGEVALVTARFDAGANLSGVPLVLEGRGIAVETPPVRLMEEREVCWRVRAARSGAATLVLRFAGTSFDKRVEVGAGFRYLAERRVASPMSWLRYPAERRIPDGSLAWIEVTYPQAEIDVFGWGMHWLIWFSLVSSATMLAFRNRFGVVF